MLKLNSFFPKEFQVTKIKQEEKNINIEISSCQKNSICPRCKQPSSRIHSHYSRVLKDLPILEKKVYLEVSVRKFFCDTHNCERRVFTERFIKFIKSYARETERLKEPLIALAFSSTARQIANFRNEQNQQW